MDGVGGEDAVHPSPEDACAVLRDRKICLTGVGSREERRVVKAIASLGGSVSRDLTRDVYCLVVYKVGSAKHTMAEQLGLPSVEAQWVLDCMLQSKLLPLSAYPVRPFLGCVITCTQLSQEGRAAAQRTIEKLGGVYSPALAKKTEAESLPSTHLVALRPEGDKHFHAKYWSIPVVSLKWIEDCCERGRWLPERLYPVLEEKKASAEAIAPTTTTAEGVSDGSSIRERQEADPCLSRVPPPFAVPLSRRALLSRDVFFITGYKEDVAAAIARLVLAAGGRRHHLFSPAITKVLAGAAADPRLAADLRRHPCAPVRVELQWLLRELGCTDGCRE